MPLDALAKGPGDAAADPVTLAAAGSHDDAPDHIDLVEAERIATGDAGAETLEQLLRLVRRFPASERLQVLALRQLDRVDGRSAAVRAWDAFIARHPGNHEAFLIIFRTTARRDGRPAALAMLRARFPTEPDDPTDLVLRARCLEEVGDVRGASADFARASLRDPCSASAPLQHAKALERRGDPGAARRVLLSASRRGAPASRLRPEIERLSAQEARAAALPSMPNLPGRAGPGVRALAHLLRRATAARGQPPVRSVRSVVMVNGSLAPGGAERQLVNTALGVTRMQADDGGRVQAEVVVRSMTDRPQGDFFLPELRRAGIPVQPYDAFPEYDGRPEASVVLPWGDLLPLLHPRTADATLRLADRIRRHAPDVVHLWQDGTVLACGLAALLAGTPRIVLSVRSVPPPDRPERDRPEYATLYPLLLDAPGVVLTANSQFAAERYADWLGMPRERVTVLRNGIIRPSPEPAGDSALIGSRFDAQAGAGPTVGGIMRFDHNKRPLEWIETAARIRDLRPDVRFILVGDGDLRGTAEARAAALGLRERVLFTGHRADVGYWLRRLDVLLLLSRFEGLPNVLLEAQSVGVPVVTTPAGGAPETVLAGHVLDDAIAPDLDEAARRVLDLACPPDRAGRADAVRRQLQERFSLDRMVERTMEIYGD